MSEFWKKKMKTFFRAIDVDKDGVITEADFLLLGSLFCEKENADPIRRQQLKESLENAWKAFTKTKRKDDNEPLTESALIDSVKEQKSNPEYVAIIVEVAHNFVNVLDTNQDGFLQEDEHRRFFENMGMRDVKSFAKATFDAIDTNHDGKVSKDEFAVGAVEFMVSEDEKSPYKLFYGPLV